jgi:hypothetical protein
VGVPSRAGRQRPRRRAGRVGLPVLSARSQQPLRCLRWRVAAASRWRDGVRAGAANGVLHRGGRARCRRPRPHASAPLAERPLDSYPQGQLVYRTNATGTWTEQTLPGATCVLSMPGRCYSAFLAYNRTTDRLVVVEAHTRAGARTVRTAAKAAAAQDFGPLRDLASTRGDQRLLPTSVTSRGGQITVGFRRLGPNATQRRATREGLFVMTGDSVRHMGHLTHVPATTRLDAGSIDPRLPSPAPSSSSPQFPRLASSPPGRVARWASRSGMPGARASGPPRAGSPTAAGSSPSPDIKPTRPTPPSTPSRRWRPRGTRLPPSLSGATPRARGRPTVSDSPLPMRLGRPDVENRAVARSHGSSESASRLPSSSNATVWNRRGRRR